MQVYAPLEITPSLMAGYRFADGSLLEVDSSGDYRITDADGNVLDETVDSVPGEGMGLNFGLPVQDYNEAMDDLAAFLRHDGDLYASTADEPDHPEYMFRLDVAMWAHAHEDELSELACYREDKRLEE